MKSSLSSVTKKQNLHSDRGRPQNQVYFGLGGGLGRHPGSHPAFVDQAPKAKQYYSDGLDAYPWLWYYFGRYEISKGKAETYSVEADNAELRHYLARLAGKSRCFSRCPSALECALRLFVSAFNRRQLHRQHFPNYAAHLIDFLSP